MKQRWQRLGRHLQSRTTAASGIYPGHFFWRTLEAALLLTDCLFFPEILTALNRFFKRNTRRLTTRELALARTIFGENIDYQKVLLDERSHLGCRQRHFAYVGFNVINCWGTLSEAHFIHELIHVWQFQKNGSVYIARALWAQRTPAGYNYGGPEAIRKALEQGRGLEAYNYEQQGDVVADYFCLKNGLQPRWCAAESSYLPTFETIITSSLPCKSGG